MPRPKLPAWAKRRRCDLTLPGATIDALTVMAKRAGTSRSEVVERLVREEGERTGAETVRASRRR